MRWMLQEPAIGFHHRSRLGPTSAPIAAARPMPSVYQVRMKSAETSGQCRQYSVAAHAPEANPAEVPAARRRVGASRRNDHSNPMKIGADSISTSQGHFIQLCPSHIVSQSAGGACAISSPASNASSVIGIVGSHNRRRRTVSGRASRPAMTAHRHPAMPHASCSCAKRWNRFAKTPRSLPSNSSSRRTRVARACGPATRKRQAVAHGLARSAGSHSNSGF